MSAISNILHAISDHGNALVSKAVTYFGVVSIGGGGALGVASGTAEKIAQNQSFGLPDWAAIVSIVGGICLIIKNSIDAYYTIQDRRERKKAKNAAKK
jgi:hypothetical protein